jgi:histidinol phosphatase-like PHP family hydrolase/predicted nuclease with RNAse H fold/dephospho-CoA kinase
MSATLDDKQQRKIASLPKDYFQPRDFEYVQSLYDLAFLLQIDALANQNDVPEYRTFALWKAALSLDGYSSNVNLWLQNPEAIELLDYDPSDRIRAYLMSIKTSGILPDLEELDSSVHHGCLRLRSIRGMGAKQISEALAQGGLTEVWLNRAVATTGMTAKFIAGLWEGKSPSLWQAAHVIPPLLRLLYEFEAYLEKDFLWGIPSLSDGLQPISNQLEINVYLPPAISIESTFRTVVDNDHFFNIVQSSEDGVVLAHRLGWQASFKNLKKAVKNGKRITDWAGQLDALLHPSNALLIKGDLHTHTHWSDGTAALTEMADAAGRNGLEYIAITDHSRYGKLQNGLTPVAWIHQAISLSLLKPSINIFHGIESEIRADGSLDLPTSLLEGMDIVIGAIHTAMHNNQVSNTNRLLQAISSGKIDIIGHPTNMVLGLPGVPTYQRPGMEFDWDRLFEVCRKWRVALEFNCFPSRLDLTLPLLKKASSAGCWITFGTDAHSRVHLKHINIAQQILPLIDTNRVLNLLTAKELKQWLKESKLLRANNTPERLYQAQPGLFPETIPDKPKASIRAQVSAHAVVPAGSMIVGLDLTASKAKPTGVAILDGLEAQTCSLRSDEEILTLIKDRMPAIVSIDSPLGLPGGGSEISPSAGIVRVAEHDLASVGIPAYPALIDSMKPLTLRGINLRRQIESMPNAPKVIESYPGAAQDILCIPRKQKGLELLRAGLRELGLQGPGLDTQSHDEMDAITSAIVGRFYEVGEFEAMGIPAEAQLIVPKLNPLSLSKSLVICLAGKKGAGKSVVARYLALFFGFHWLKTRDVVRSLLVDDIHLPIEKRMYTKPVDEHSIQEIDLDEFGILLLERCNQKPIIARICELVAAQKRPVVVDAVRDLADYVSLPNLNHEVKLWFIDAPDAAIQKRLESRQNGRARSVSLMNRIDQKMDILKTQAQQILRNNASLEDLRWRIDDEFFTMLGMANSS